MDLGSAFQGRSVFVTGHTGFKGSWLALWLHDLGARVTGYALAPASEPSNFLLSGLPELLAAHHEADLRDQARLEAALAQAEPDVVLHLAAQSLVRPGYAQPRETFEVNVLGTVNLLEAVRRRGRSCATLVVTSDKVYRNREQVWGYRESDELGGRDPYSASKGAAELVARSYRESYGMRIATARAGNVIGGGDWCQDRILPDAVRALVAGRAVPVRSPRSVRPWQHVLEPLSGYLLLAARLLESEQWCGAWNFGPVSGAEVPVGRLVEMFCEAWGGGRWEDVSDPSQPHEASILRVSIDQAVWELGWSPRWTVEEAVRRSAAWYRHWHDGGQGMREACRSDLAAYQAAPSLL